MPVSLPLPGSYMWIYATVNMNQNNWKGVCSVSQTSLNKELSLWHRHSTINLPLLVKYRIGNKKCFSSIFDKIWNLPGYSMKLIAEFYSSSPTSQFFIIYCLKGFSVPYLLHIMYSLTLSWLVQLSLSARLWYFLSFYSYLSLPFPLLLRCFSSSLFSSVLHNVLMLLLSLKLTQKHFPPGWACLCEGFRERELRCCGKSRQLTHGDRQEEAPPISRTRTNRYSQLWRSRESY